MSDAVKLMMIVDDISAAMEHHRKGRTDGYIRSLMDALTLIYAVSGGYADERTFNTFVLDSIIEEKREYNRQRADHKPENRKKVGGKAY